MSGTGVEAELLKKLVEQGEANNLKDAQKQAHDARFSNDNKNMLEIGGQAILNNLLTPGKKISEGEGLNLLFGSHVAPGQDPGLKLPGGTGPDPEGTLRSHGSGSGSGGGGYTPGLGGGPT